MADVSVSFYKLIEDRLAKLEKEMKATEDSVRTMSIRAEEHGLRCELASNRLEDLGRGMEMLNDTVECLAEGLIALPGLCPSSTSRTRLDSPNIGIPSALVETYVAEFQSIFNEQVKRAMRKRLDRSSSFPSLGGISSAKCNISNIEEKARDSVRRRLGLNEGELQSLESFTVTSANRKEDKFEGAKIDPNNNEQVFNEKFSTKTVDNQDVMDLLRDLSMDDHESSHSIRVAIATVHAARASDLVNDATLEENALYDDHCN